MLKGDIEMLLKKHTMGVNSFVDDKGKNHWYDLIDDIFNLAQKELKEQRESLNNPDLSSSSDKKITHNHYRDGKAIEYSGTARECKDPGCLVKHHSHVEEKSTKITDKDGSIEDCTDYCKKHNNWVLDPHNHEWIKDEKADDEVVTGLPQISMAWSRDCVFTQDMMRTVHTRLTGKILTLVDASIVEGRQNKALKDLIHNAIWQETWQPIVGWLRDQDQKKGYLFPFYHEPQGLDQ